MSGSPVRARVHSDFLTAEETALRTHLQKVLPRLDQGQPPDNTLTSRQHVTTANVTYDYYAVAGATPKWKWVMFVTSTEGMMHEFMEHYDAAVATGSYQAPAADMNPLRREAAATSFYLDEALETLADTVALRFAGNVSGITATSLVQRGYMPSLRVLHG